MWAALAQAKCLCLPVLLIVWLSSQTDAAQALDDSACRRHWSRFRNPFEMNRLRMPGKASHGQGSAFLKPW
jgi:hypothetical protein